MCFKFLLLIFSGLVFSNVLPAQQPYRVWASYFGYSANYPNTLFSYSGTNVTSSVYDPKSK